MAKIPVGNPNEAAAASARLRVAIAVAVGLIGAGIAAELVGLRYAPIIGYDVAAVTYLVWLFFTLRGRDAKQTANLAVREDPGRSATDVLLILSSVASLGAVGIVLSHASQAQGVAELLQVGLGILSVVISWTLVHALYTLRYARIYYHNKGGIDFNSAEPPTYGDFAYVAFTLGMTFQVSDTSFQTRELRQTALKHALLGYLFGTVIVATTINLIAGLSH